MAVSTVTATKQGGRMETDGMLAMVRWLNCTAESFIRGAESVSVAEMSAANVRSSAGHRFNTKALYAALDAQRRSRTMTWREVAHEMGDAILPGMLTRLAKGWRIGVDVMVAAVEWPGATVESFTRDRK